jgi:phospholipid/cholesterol/gamma-HCH transport system ATP-binding protein
MIGLKRPVYGVVDYGGESFWSATLERQDVLKRRFGTLFQAGALWSSMTLAENVALPLKQYTALNDADIRELTAYKLSLVGLAGFEDYYPSELSGGMKKRAGLARALALDPRILFYDEPSAGLDPVTSAEIDRLIIGLTRKMGVTSVVVTHEMDSAFTIADRMAMLDKGRMVVVEKREWFERLRDTAKDQVSALTEDQQMIRQFLRGEADGPITARREATRYADDLLGVAYKPSTGPSVEPTRY